MSADLPTVWNAEPHTIAKIEMLKCYLRQWFTILGSKFSGKDLWYVDGFAGPGEYTNYDEGSPVAALAAAASAFDAHTSWRARNIHCFFIEEDAARFQNLQRKLSEVAMHSRIHRHLFHGSFVDGVAWLRGNPINPFTQTAPVFAFIDPFGPTGLSFNAVQSFLSNPSCEVLVNLDSDGIDRIYKAGEHAKSSAHLNDVYGTSEWEAALASGGRQQAIQNVLSLYKKRLREIPGINYAFAFEMRKKHDQFDYHLVFASGHPLGLEKMKEAMKSIDKTGAYCFSDSYQGQQHLFTFDDPSDHAAVLAQRFSGRRVRYREVNDFSLNDTSFLNPKKMLKLLEDKGAITVESVKPRRAGQYPETAQDGMWISFVGGT